MPEPRILPRPADLKLRLEAERRGIPFLVFNDADGEQHLITLAPDSDSLSIGRDSECDVCLSWDDEVSRLHALLTRRGGSWTIYDGGLSRNGTFLNAQRVEGHRVLRDGDRLHIGVTDVTFRDPSPKQPSTAMSAEKLAGPHISPAEKRVLVALCAPYRNNAAFASPSSNRAIATQLVLSVEAVKGHLRVLFSKFGLDTLQQNEKRARLAAEVLRLGIVSESDLREVGRDT